MKKPLRALIIEDSEFDAVLLVNQLRLGQYLVTWQRVDTAEAMTQALAGQPWDIVFSDHQMPHFSAPEGWLRYQLAAIALFLLEFPVTPTFSLAVAGNPSVPRITAEATRKVGDYRALHHILVIFFLCLIND